MYDTRTRYRAHMTVYDNVADATVQVLRVHGGSGSGFHYRSDRIVITNRHVVGADGWVTSRTESGERRTGEVIARSTLDNEDWAVIRLSKPFSSVRNTLEPSRHAPARGQEVIFAGYPHGMDELLTHRATLSAVLPWALALDGSVNGGNSGGPAVDTAGNLVGIVTARRLISDPATHALVSRAEQLILAARAGRENGAMVSMMGVDLGELYQLIGETAAAARQIAIHDANTGIGFAFFPDAALAAADAVDLA